MLKEYTAGRRVWSDRSKALRSRFPVRDQPGGFAGLQPAEVAGLFTRDLAEVLDRVSRMREKTTAPTRDALVESACSGLVSPLRCHHHEPVDIKDILARIATTEAPLARQMLMTG